MGLTNRDQSKQITVGARNALYTVHHITVCIKISATDPLINLRIPLAPSD